MSLHDDVIARAKELFGPDAEVAIEDRPARTRRGKMVEWYVLRVPGHNPIAIGMNGSEAMNALNLADAAGSITALSDGMVIRNPSWRARGWQDQ